MEPTTALIAAIIGAVAAGVVNIIKAAFSRNENRALAYQHEERLIELVGKQNDNGEKLLMSINELTSEVSSIHKELGGLTKRIEVLENERH